MRIVEVDPEEERLCPPRARAQPAGGRSHRAIAAPLELERRRHVRRRRVERVVVVREPAREAELPVEHERADERRRVVARGRRTTPPASARPRRSVKWPLFRTPWVYGWRPVMRLACDGSVNGADDSACSKRTPAAASRSRFGVAAAA